MCAEIAVEFYMGDSKSLTDKKNKNYLLSK